jgi:subtilase family serine protease
MENAAVIQAYLSTDDVFDPLDASLGFCRWTLTAPDLVLLAGESTQVHVACHAEPKWGLDYLIVVADSLDGVPESDETNNVGSVLTPAVDLTISSIVVDETQLSGRYAFDVTVHIDTTVPIETGGVGILTYYSNDQVLDDGDNPGCSAIQTDSNIVPESGDFQTFRISCTTLPGSTDNFLIVKVDYADVIHEFSEDNNSLVQTLTRLT